MEKFIELEDGFSLLIRGLVVGDDKDIVFYGKDLQTLHLSSPAHSKCTVTAAAAEDKRDNNNNNCDDDDKNSKPRILDENRVCGYFHFFNLKSYLTDIWNSFAATEIKIIKQLELDFYRQDYFINDVKCTCLETYLDFIHRACTRDWKCINKTDHGYNTSNTSTTNGIASTNRRWFINKCSDDDDNGGTGGAGDTVKQYQLNILHQHTDTLMLMLSTQSSFAYIFEFMQKCYPDMMVVQSRNSLASRPQIRLYSSPSIMDGYMDCFVSAGSNMSTMTAVTENKRTGMSSSSSGVGTHNNRRMEINLHRDLFDTAKECIVEELYCNLNIDLDNLCGQKNESLGVLSLVTSKI